MQKNKILLALGLTVVIFFTVLTLNLNINSQNAGARKAVIVEDASSLKDANSNPTISSIPQTSCLNTTTCYIGGTVTGLLGTLVIVENGSNPFTITTDGFYSLPQYYPNNYSYNVTISSQPIGQTCIIVNGTGTISNFKNVTNVDIYCQPPTYSVGGIVTGLNTGLTLILKMNGANTLNITQNGPYIFPIAVKDGTAYSASKIDPLGQTCTISNKMGVISGANVTNVDVNCINTVNISKLISAGDWHTCAITPTSGLKCWGDGAQGQLGNNSWSASSTPVSVTGMSTGVVSVSAGENVTCAVQNGAAKCWGQNNLNQLGDGTMQNKNSPIFVPTLSSGVTDISVGYKFACAVQNGAAKCWGEYISSTTPIIFAGLNSGVTAISAGFGYLCVIQNNNVKCGSSGINSVAQVPGLNSGVTSISVGEFHESCAVQNGTTLCWDNANKITYPISGLSSNTTVVSRSNFVPVKHACVLLNSGEMKCWGNNYGGQLGNGNITNSTLAVFVKNSANNGNLLSSLAITTGYEYSCALSNTSTVKCWGKNNFGNLGNGVTNSTPNTLPVSVLNFP